VTELQLTR